MRIAGTIVTDEGCGEGRTARAERLGHTSGSKSLTCHASPVICRVRRSFNQRHSDTLPSSPSDIATLPRSSAP